MQVNPGAVVSIVEADLATSEGIIKVQEAAVEQVSQAPKAACAGV